MKKSHADIIDPLEEIRAIRTAISGEFKTVSAYGEYLRDKYPSANTKARVSTTDSQTVVKARQSPTSKSIKKTTGQRKISKRVAHT